MWYVVIIHRNLTKSRFRNKSETRFLVSVDNETESQNDSNIRAFFSIKIGFLQRLLDYFQNKKTYVHQRRVKHLKKKFLKKKIGSDTVNKIGPGLVIGFSDNETGFWSWTT